MECDCQSDLAEKVREKMYSNETDQDTKKLAIVLAALVSLAIAIGWYCLSDPEICKRLRNMQPDARQEPPIHVEVTVTNPTQEPVEVPVAVAEVTSDKDFEVKEPAPKPELTPEQKKAIEDQVKKQVAEAVAAERRRDANRELEKKVLKYAVKSILSDDDDDGGFGGW